MIEIKESKLNMNEGICAIVLAAGYSSRMGQLKGLMELDGASMLKRAIDLFLNNGIKDVCVVIGHDHERVEEALSEEPVRMVFNKDYDRGMFTSIKAGLSSGAGGCGSGCFILPVDFPLVKPETLKRLMEAATADPGKWIVPTFQGKKGHPLYIPPGKIQEVLSHEGPDGLKGVTEKHRDDFIKVPVADEGVVLDIDDLAAYDYARHYLQNGQKSQSLASLGKGRRFVLVRHGQTRQHKSKIFLGQTDIPLSPIGKVQAKEAAQRVLSNIHSVGTIYTSDLSRASETADIIANEMERWEREKPTLDKPKVESLKFLREMHLGDWDGKTMEAIAAREPEEFAYRGEHLLEYKRGNLAENFYDLQYRVLRGMAELLSRETHEEVIIVAHQSVLRAISHNLQGIDISAPWKPMAFGEVRVVDLT
jgi:CTP:molybdopterin cytidylyltransferase MocA/broad specificity phosphatase PhoE